MKRTPAKLISVFMAAAVVTLSGCFGVTTDHSFEGTVAAGTKATSSSTAPYVRQDFNPSGNPYFAMLSETEKNAYSLIYEELSKGNDKFECTILLTSTELSKAIDCVLNDHPEIFWVDNNYGFTYDPSDGSIKEINFKFFDFADTPEKLSAARFQFEAVANAIVSQAMTYQSTVDRELFIHDYICNNTEYDEDCPYNQTAYSALVKHSSVCAGYAKSFQYLMQKSGVVCYYVTGRTDGLSSTSGGSDGDGSHSWNIVLLENEFYNVDCLWDDTASDAYGSLIYPFFNLTDTDLIYHARINMATGLPKCNGTKYKYSNHFGPTIEATGITFY